jgi:hypothetical protein
MGIGTVTIPCRSGVARPASRLSHPAFKIPPPAFLLYGSFFQIRE